MDGLVTTPAVPEKANGYHNSPRNHRWKPPFRFHRLPAGCFLLHRGIADHTESAQPDKHPYANAEIRETNDAGGPVVCGFENFGDCGEQEIEIAW